MGTAYLTPVPPSVYTTESDVSAVYAVWPPALFGGSVEETTFLLVTSSELVGDTIVHPCDPAGEMLAWDMVAHVPVADHLAALAAAGYELEVVVARGA